MGLISIHTIYVDEVYLCKIINGKDIHFWRACQNFWNQIPTYLEPCHTFRGVCCYSYILISHYIGLLLYNSDETFSSGDHVSPHISHWSTISHSLLMIRTTLDLYRNIHYYCSSMWFSRTNVFSIHLCIIQMYNCKC